MLFFWTAVCAVLMVMQTRSVAGQSLDPDWLEGFVFFSTIFAYNAMAQVMWRKIGAYLLALPLAYCWWQLPGYLQMLTVAPGLLWAVYHGLPGRLGLREMPWLKPFAVSLAWAGVTVWLPLPPSQWLLWGGALIGRAAFVFGLALGYDLIDRAEDRRSGLRTLAGVLGVQATLRVAYIAFGVCAVTALLNYGLMLVPFRVVWAVWGSLALSAWLTGWQLRRFGPQQWEKISLDAMLIVQAVAVMLTV